MGNFLRDYEIFDLIKKEKTRQEDHLELIASENFEIGRASCRERV